LAAATGKTRLKVIIDVDPGIRRTGVSSPETAVTLLKAIHAHEQIVYRGVQFYCGMQQHVPGFEDRRTAIVERTEFLRTVIAALTGEGGKPELISGSGTGTHRIDAELSLFNEWQVGSYVFMDRQYADCQLGADPGQLYEYSLFVDARIVSANTPGMGTSDAGFKALATDGGPPAIVSGAPAGATFHFMGDEHGLIIDPTFKHVWQIGDSVRLAVPHCDPTVNLYDAYHVVSGDTLVEIWPVTARGRSR
jgi:D-serine deaminase-like pyridoxal phosphate-dependent protein